MINMPGQGLGKVISFGKCLETSFVLFDAQIFLRIAYVLADANFDVWILNCRGNFYSRENIFMDPDNPANGFWDFSWDDIAFEGDSANFQGHFCLPEFKHESNRIRNKTATLIH